MTSSMTAFTRQQSEQDWGSLVWEIRSVNHRYLEPSFRLPDALRHLEGRLRELLRGAVHRGKVETTLKYAPNAALQQLELNEALVDQLVSAEGRLRARLEAPAAASPLELLKWPGVIREQEMDQDRLEAETLELFRRALDSLLEQRRREGAELQALVKQRLDALGVIIRDIREAMPAILDRQRDKLRGQFEDLKLDADPSRLEQEIVLAVQKADIHEEVDRLETHVKEVARILRESGAIGRRLDFLMQELNREANTICSKAVVTDTTSHAVELKVLIEQMREQIQNIE